MRLAANAGSILEDDDQRGLSHMSEHTAYNGIGRYAKSEVVDYLEFIGMRCGPEIMAAASRYVNTQRYVRLNLFPEG